jgi:ornithine decarboxylase
MGLSEHDIALRLGALRERPKHFNPASVELVEALGQIPHSVLVLDTDQVAENYLSFLESHSDLKVYYAVKAGPHPAILQTIADLGGGFDVASPAEVDLVIATGVSPEKCVYTNAASFPEDISYAFRKGVRVFVTDSENGLHKQATSAPGSKFLVRIIVDSNPHAAHPLGDKFGTTPANAITLLRLGRDLGLEPYGTHFHVGNRCYSAEAWIKPARDAAQVFAQMGQEGVELTLFDIGGGYPTPFPGRPIPSVKDILDTVERVLGEELPGHGVMLATEPGRGLCGSAGLIRARVTLRAPRLSGDWIYLDTGTYHGLTSSPAGGLYPVTVPHRSGAPAPFTLCGPTCDSADIIATGQLLPNDVTDDDLVIFDMAGAYSDGLFTRFNGIEPPKVMLLNELLPNSKSYCKTWFM